jgi:signal transduction histidine kinase
VAADLGDLRRAITAVDEAVLIIDAADNVLMTNAPAEQLFSGAPIRTGDDVRSRFELLPGEPRGVDHDLAVLRLRGEPNRWFELRTVAIAPAGVAVAQAGSRSTGASRMFLLRDVTAGRRPPAESNAYLSLLSHVLRTPLTTIYAGSRVLARDNGRLPVKRTLAADISAEAARLYDTVEDLLVLARLERGSLETDLEGVGLGQAIETALRALTSREPDVSFHRTGQREPSAVEADPGHVEHAVRNLATAAARFGGADRPVVIDLRTEQDGVSLRVLDRGPTPTRADAALAFELGTLAATPRRAAGSVSLYVVRRLVEAMGGSIWATARPGGGAEHGLWLPLAHDGTTASGGAGPQPLQ